MTAAGTALVQGYEGVVCDLDGVVYRGQAPVPHAVDALERLSVPVQYATNNASRPPRLVARHLAELGLRCGADDVATSAQAGAWMLADRLPQGARVLAVGGPGVSAALEEAGLTPVLPTTGESVAAVLQGYGPDVSASHLGEVAYAVQDGAVWLATNTDGTLPTDRGVAPGNGSLVAAVERACGRGPDAVAGKPRPPLYLLCAQRLAVEPSRVLAIGDRLDTDIEGAVAAGMDSLLVLTGVDDLASVLRADPARRPTYVSPDLRALHSDPGEGTGDGASLASLWDAIGQVHAARDGRERGGDRLVHLERAAEEVLAGLLRR